MSTLREALEKALRALKSLDDNEDNGTPFADLGDARSFAHRMLTEILCDLHQGRATPPSPVPEPWGYLCNGKGDGWEEIDKVVRDPALIARYREQPDRWRVEPLYLHPPAPGHTDLMVTPESIDEWLENNPLEQPT